MALAKVPKPPRIPNPEQVKMMEALDDQSAVKQEYLKRLCFTEYGVDGPCTPENFKKWKEGDLETREK